jgi:hypothetical protein
MFVKSKWTGKKTEAWQRDERIIGEKKSVAVPDSITTL